MKRILRFVYTRIKSYLAELYLALLKKSQREKFKYLKKIFIEHWNKIASENVQDFITSPWEEYNKVVEKIFIPNPSFSFLRTRVISTTMVVGPYEKWVSEELKLLKKVFSNGELKKLLIEDYFGRPLISNYKYWTSNNSIHHLYHIIRFENKTGIQIRRVDSVIEWGGGYGNMCKIIKRMNSKLTYTIIDTPIFSCIQWLYLSTILGADSVNLIEDSESYIERGKINLLPVCFLKQKAKELNAEVFIATWSLSESSKFAQDYIDSLNFFNSRYLLLGFQNSSYQFPDASYLGEIAKKHGASIEPIEFLPGNYYAFR